jgi:hypothetical protein
MPMPLWPPEAAQELGGPARNGASSLLTMSLGDGVRSLCATDVCHLEFIWAMRHARVQH